MNIKLGNRKSLLIKTYLFLYVLSLSFVANAQTVIQPNFGQKSHETLDVESIEITNQYTIISLSIVNKIKGGTFCADKNIYIKNSSGYEMYQIIKSEGIPQCPKSHQFKNIDEKLSFKLYFPKISEKIMYLDLIENCDNACFNVKGIILSNNLNDNINEAYRLYSVNEKKRAAENFESLIYQTKEYPYAFLYFAAIKIWQELGESNKFTELRNNLFLSDKLDKNLLH